MIQASTSSSDENPTLVASLDIFPRILVWFSFSHLFGVERQTNIPPSFNKNYCEVLFNKLGKEFSKTKAK